MAVLNLLTQVFFYFAALLGLYSTFFLAFWNGVVAYMERQRSFGYLQSVEGPLSLSYTGIAPLDIMLSNLVVFFWPVAEAYSPALTVFWINFAGQLASSWTLISLESVRVGNQGRWISHFGSVVVVGLLFQYVSYAAVLPIIWAIDLFTASTSSSKTSLTAAFASLAPNAVEASCIPLSISLAFIIPMIIWALPAPVMLSYQHKHLAMILWHAFPFSTPLLQKLVTRLFSSIPSRQSTTEQIWSLRRLYAYTVLVGTIPRIVSLTVSFATVVSPALFRQQYVEALGPKKVFVPKSPLWENLQADSFAEGLLPILQYEELIGGLSTLLWALFSIEQSWGGARGLKYWTMLLTGTPLLTFLMGPLGCAVVLIWIRDEITFNRTIESKGKDHR